MRATEGQSKVLWSGLAWYLLLDIPRQHGTFADVSGNRDYSDTRSANNILSVVLLTLVGSHWNCDYLNLSPLNILCSKGGENIENILIDQLRKKL